MQLLQLLAEHLKLGRSLPWNVYDGSGQLLLAVGYTLASQHQLETLLKRGVYADADEIKRYRGAQQKAKEQPFDPFWLWSDLQVKLSLLLREHKQTEDFADRLITIARLLQLLCEKDADVGVFVMMQHDATKYAVAHSLHAAIVCELITLRMGWTDEERLPVVAAALTMNIGMLELQSMLAAHSGRPSEAQKAEIRNHPRRSVELLQAAGVTAGDWLRAVYEHHEMPGGGGYPRGVPAAFMPAEIIRHADIFGAKISERAGRKALPPNIAVKDLYMSMGGAGNPIAALLVKEIGIFPPGCFVKLTNGETAVVVRRGEKANAPIVYSVANPNGVAYMDAVKRDTARTGFTITGSISRQNILARIDPGRLFGYETT